MAFADDIALRPLGDGGFAARIDPGWEVVRGPLGGYVAALLLEAMTEALADRSRHPRSLTVHFLRPPQPGPATVRPAVERSGGRLSTLSTRLEQDGRPAALALAAFSGPWGTRRHEAAPMPPVPPPDVRESRLAELPGGRPPFTERMVMHPRFGAPPFSGAGEAEVGGWLGLAERRPIDAPLVALLADAWFPAPFPLLDAPAPAPTVDFTVHFRAVLPHPSTEADDLVLGRFRTRCVRDGFFEEDGELWGPDGTLLAQSRQLALLVEPGP